jgi:hypothetical protein
MKKILSAACLLLMSLGIANAMNAPTSVVNDNNMMYLNFGLGMGTATGWNQNSLALNAMTMGVYLQPTLAAEIGMDSLPDGGNAGGQGMIMAYHLAVKKLFPVSQHISVYGKAGLGINSNEGEAPSAGMYMINQVSAGLYYAAGVQYNFNNRVGLYVEGSGIAVPVIGNNGSIADGSFGSTYQGTLGIELRI